MSLSYYFFSFRPDLLQKLLGQATAKQQQKLVKAMTDPEENGDLDEEEIEQRTALARGVLERGIDYTGKSPPEAAELDEVVKMIFHRMGLEKDLKAKQLSNGMTVEVGAELAQVAAIHRPESLLALFDYGRRLGETDSSMCGYIVFKHAEVVELHRDVAELLGDDSVEWSDPEFPPVIRTDVLTPLAKAVANTDCDLYAVCT